MKSLPLLGVIALALGLGFLIGRQNSAKPQGATREAPPSRETRASRPKPDALGAAAFSLSSVEDVRKLFRQQRWEIASAKLAISVESLSPKEISAMMEKVQTDFRENPSEHDVPREALMSTLFGRWAALDPSAALAFVHSSKQRSFKNAATSACFAGLAAADPSRAIAEMQSLPKGELRETAASAIIFPLGKKDPAAACDLLQNEPSRSGFSSYYAREIFKNWARDDPKAAAARLATMPDEIVGQYSIGGLASVWAKSDPDAALTWAASLRGEKKSAATMEIYSSLARQDPAAAWEKIKDQPGQLRGKLCASVLSIIADDDLQKAVALLKDMSVPSERRIAVGELIENFSWRDPRLAFSILDQMNDPAAAEKYYLALPEAQRGGPAMSALLQQYASKDPQAALAFASGLSNPQEQNSAITGVFSAWGREDPEAAAGALKNLPAGEARLGALGNLASSWANTDPAAAATWAESLGGAERAIALAVVLPSLAKDDPATAAARLATLLNSPPDGAAQHLANAAGNIAGNWAADNPAAAADWIGTLPAGTSRDAAVKPLVQQVTQSDPATAFSWAATIGDPAARVDLLGQALQSWRGTDLAAARAALDAADLSPEDRTKLQKQLE